MKSLSRLALTSSCLLALVACGGSQGATSQPTAASEVVTRPAQPLVDLSTPPPPGEPSPYELPAVETFELDNGLAVVLVNRPEFPTLAVRLGIRAGTDSTGGNPALSELTTRLLRDGTTSMNSEEIARYIDSNGLVFGAGAGDNSASLSVDGLSTQLPEMLTLLADLAMNANFPEDRYTARREELLGELQLAEAQPSFHLGRVTDQVLFGDHVYGQALSAENVEAVTREALVEFYQGAYGANRSRLVIVGALPDNARDTIRDTLGGWNASAVEWQVEAPPAISTCNEAHVVFRPNSAQTSIRWVGPAVASDDADYFPAMIANEILGGGIIGRLFMNLRERRSFTYGAYSAMRELEDAAWFTASSEVRSDVTADALGAFLEEFNRWQTETLPEQDLSNNISYLSGVFPIELARNGAIAGRLLSLYFSGLDAPEFLENYRAQVNAATVESVTTAGRDMINPSNFALIMVGEEAAVRPAALQYASKVYVYDLDGELVETLEGEAPSTCPE